MAAEQLKSWWIRVPRSWRNFLSFGAPMIAMVVGFSFALKEFQDIKMDVRDRKSRKLTTEETLKYRKDKKESVTLEEAYEEMQQKVDIDNWENKRGPRPWEMTEEQGKDG